MTPAGTEKMHTASPFAEPTPALIVFVTGVGQSFSYLFDEKYLAPGAFKSGTLADLANHAPLIEEGKEVESWNLFAFNAKEGLSRGKGRRALVKTAGALLGSAVFRRNLLREKTARQLVGAFFALNLLDANGDADPRAVTPRYPGPFSSYPGVTDENGVFRSRAKARFYRSVPCEALAKKALGERFEDYLYCFNYRPCSLTSRNVEDLRAFIETALEKNRVGASQVVLVPMSMGASVVSAYLAKYPDPAKNRVRRVVSVVGCWQGSGVMTDLLDRAFAGSPKALIEKGVLGETFGREAERRLRPALRLFSDKALSGLFDTLLGAIVEELILPTPSLLALAPPETIERLLPALPEVSREETRAYLAAQKSVLPRLEALKEAGVDFSFVCGYGAPYGALSSDCAALSLLRHAKEANSDELIDISSAAPGVRSVPAGRSFPEKGQRLSPDGSLDLTDAPFADETWFFLRQKHELEDNNTALSLALSLALGQVKNVGDCADPEKTPFFPQFNGARDLKRFYRDDMPRLNAFLSSGGTLTEAQQTLADETLRMTERTVNDPEKDRELLDRFSEMAKGLKI